MKKIIAVFLVFSLLWLSGSLYAEKKGAEVVIQKKDGQQVKGELITVKKNSLLLKESRADVAVDVNDITIIKIAKKSKAIYGLLGGAILGAVIGYSIKEGVPPLGGKLSEEARSNDALIGGAFMGLCGAGIGALYGKDKKIQIEGKSDSEIRGILQELRKKARIPDFQ